MQIASSLLCCVLATCGCRSTESGTHPETPRQFGSVVDRMMQQQEDNAEPAKFVIYMHEFELNKPEWETRLNQKYEGRLQGFRLTPYGQDHLRRIAVELQDDQSIQTPVVVERNQTSIRESTKHKYSVHYGDDLDGQRRDVVVRALSMLGIEDAARRVIVAPAYSEGLPAEDAAAAYSNNFGQQGSTGRGGGGGGARF